MAQLNESAYNIFYNTSKAPDMDDPLLSHQLALLYMILAIGSLMDTTRPAYNVEAEKYHQLARAALFQSPIFEEPTLTAVQSLVSIIPDATTDHCDADATLQYLMAFYLFLSERHGSGVGPRWAFEDGQRRDREHRRRARVALRLGGGIEDAAHAAAPARARCWRHRRCKLRIAAVRCVRHPLDCGGAFESVRAMLRAVHANVDDARTGAATLREVLRRGRMCRTHARRYSGKVSLSIRIVRAENYLTRPRKCRASSRRGVPVRGASRRVDTARSTTQQRRRDLSRRLIQGEIRHE